MKKITAVEWFYQTIIKDPIGDWGYYFEQAKKMEKEQIIEAFWKGEFFQGCNGDGEKYYNELFEKK